MIAKAKKKKKSWLSYIPTIVPLNLNMQSDKEKECIYNLTETCQDKILINLISYAWIYFVIIIKKNFFF